MPLVAPLDQRARHQLREQAIWRTKVAAYAAFASATLGLVMFTMIALDTGEWGSVAPYLLGAGLNVALGMAILHRRSQLAAAALMILAASTMILRFVQTGTFGSLLVGVVLIYCYVQGFRGAMDLAELAKSEEASSVQQAT